jgi:hypothetical protein
MELLDQLPAALRTLGARGVSEIVGTIKAPEVTK